MSNHAAVADLKSVIGIVVGRHAECKLGWVVGAGAAGLLKDICNPGFTLWAHGFVPSTWFGTSQTKWRGAGFVGRGGSSIVVGGVGVAD